jgi:hypothetical protein
MNNASSVTSLPIPLEQAIFPRGRVPHEKRLVVHLDNCFIHKSLASTGWLKEYRIHCKPRQFYLPNLASRDCYLFSPAAKNSNGFSWLTSISFFEDMHKMLRGLDRQELNSVFQVWVG